MENVLYDLYEIIKDRKTNPKDGSYTNYLFDKGIDKILKKIGEESAETIIAAKNNDKNETVYEMCDLLYHMSVLMADMDITWDDVLSELARRELKEGNLKKFNVKGEI
ncbi:MAG: phosphoribosyl-ATP diphosphatase [Firmicutes bacterium]|nr:phosphoribosyl-ATP diphosphatase [Bacillota bacterium]